MRARVRNTSDRTQELPEDVRRHRVYCRPCRKWAYPSRKAAKRAARSQRPGQTGLHAYPCPEAPGRWHFDDQAQVGSR